jgi:Iron-containing redox enzyme
MSNVSNRNPTDTEKRAIELRHTFAQLPPYPKHGMDDPYLRWLRSVEKLPLDGVVHFFNAWRPLSAHQPQILYLLAAAFPEQRDRKRMAVGNIWEEDGYQDGHDAHVVLLDQLIIKMGGTPVILERTERIMDRFHQGLWRPTTPARSAGLAAGIEHVAMQISQYFHEVVLRSGFPELLKTDLYLTIHVQVEPQHIVDTHEIALRYMANSPRERAEVLAAFEEVLTFWADFWNATFDDLQRLLIAS